jgi:hypothetical protein
MHDFICRQSGSTDCEALLQITVNKLNNVLNEHDVTVSTSFRGQNITEVKW